MARSDYGGWRFGLSKRGPTGGAKGRGGGRHSRRTMTEAVRNKVEWDRRWKSDSLISTTATVISFWVRRVWDETLLCVGLGYVG